jgi:periplasmic protein CpxP/Spy
MAAYNAGIANGVEKVGVMIRTGQLVTGAALLGSLLIAAASQPQADSTPVLLVQASPAAPPRQNVEANISQLHQKLQITPAQEPQFSAVASVMRDNARAEAGAPQQPPANATAVDDLRAYIKYSEVELAGLKKMLPALEALYATLSPAQKKAADAVFRQGPGG